MTDDELAQLVDLTLSELDDVTEEDWSVPAGTLDWTCWQTIDHIVDCLFSYAMQVGAQAQSGYLPFNELHAEPNATPADLVSGLRGVTAMLLGVIRDSPVEMTASDGYLDLNLSDWCARAAFEIAVHTHDILSGLGLTLSLPSDLCDSILASESLWMLNRQVAKEGLDPWRELLSGAGRWPGEWVCPRSLDSDRP